jgi:hypothetical protein
MIALGRLYQKRHILQTRLQGQKFEPPRQAGLRGRPIRRKYRASELLENVDAATGSEVDRL